MSAISSLKTLMRSQWSIFCVRSNSSNGPSHSAVDTPEKYKSQDVQFSGDRSRDFMGQAFSAKEAENDRCSISAVNESAGSREVDDFASEPGPVNDKLESYDCHGSVNLNAVMQSTVPEPFSSKGSKAPAHYNMPGGHTLQGQKYLSDNLQNAHCQHESKREFASRATSSNGQCLKSASVAGGSRNVSSRNSSCAHATNDKGNPSEDHREGAGQKLTSKEKLKRAVKDYGSTVLVFHVSISLVSLGVCYLAVSSGIDVSHLLEKVVDANGLAAGVGTFARAYAIHKVFAPVRIGVTLAAVPLIVRYLRSIGFLRSHKKTGVHACI